MRFLAVFLIVSLLLSGCVGVDGEPLPTAGDIYSGGFETGFINGCMASIFFLTSADKLPPFETGLRVCAEIRSRVGEDVISPGVSAPAQPESPPPPPAPECRDCSHT